MAESILKIDGAVEHVRAFTFEDLRAMPAAAQVEDVSRFHPKRRGDGVTLESLLALARPAAGANFITLHAGKDDFHVSVPLELLRGEGIVVYRLGEAPLGPENHGPVRLLVRDPLVCQTGELDDCANVKYLDRIELTIQRGRDTRPTNEQEHAELHAKE